MAEALLMTPELLVAKWFHIIRNEGVEAKMNSFGVTQIYDPDYCYFNDYPSEVRLCEGDANKVGFLIGLGYDYISNTSLV